MDIRDDQLMYWNAVGLVIPWALEHMKYYTDPELDKELEAIGRVDLGDDGSFYLQLAIRRKK